MCLDPWKMVSTPEEAVKMFQAVLQKVIHSGWKISSQGDSLLSQFRRFVSDARKHHQEQFSSYKHSYTRLDSFLCDTLSKDEEFKELWSTLQILLTLSHSSGCCWKRVFCQQRSAGSKHAGDELESNQTCVQLCCISEDQDIRLHCDWQTFEIL